MEPRTKEPGSPVATADVDDVAATFKAKAHVSPAGEKPKRHLESPDKAPRNRAGAQKTTANSDDKKTFKPSPMKGPSAGDEYGAAAATPTEPAAAAEEEKDEEVVDDVPPPLPPRRAVVNMSDDDESDDDIVDPIFQVVPAPEAIDEATSAQLDATVQQGGADAGMGASLISVGSSARGEGVNLIFNESHVLASDGARATFSLSSSVGRLDGCCAVLVRYTSRGVEVYGLTTQEARILRMDGSVDDLRTASFVPMMDSDSLLLDQGQVAARPAQFAYRLRIGPSSMNGNEPGSLDAPMAAASPALDAPVDEAMAPMSEEEAVDLAVAAMDTDAQRLRFGVPVTCPVVAMAPRITIRTWRASSTPPRSLRELLQTNQPNTAPTMARALWLASAVLDNSGDHDVVKKMRDLRVLQPLATTLDDALLAQDAREGRVLLELVSRDAALQLCHRLAESAQVEPVVLSDLAWGAPVETHTMSHAIARWTAAAYDDRLHKLTEAITYCDLVEAGTETCTSKKAGGIQKLALASPFALELSLSPSVKAIRATPQQSEALQRLLLLAPHLRNFAADDRAAEKLVENNSQYLDERDEAGRDSRALLSREGHLEALHNATIKLLAAHDDMSSKRLSALEREARTEVGLSVTNRSGTPKERAEAFLVSLADALAMLPAEDQVKARAEAYENKWQPTRNLDLVVAAHETTLRTFRHGDEFAFDPSLWNDADVDASRAALQEHYAQPRSHWATHHGLLQPGLIVEDPPENLRDGPAFHVNHYKPEDAEDIARSLRFNTRDG